ncbi:MAG: ATP synthase subunit I [Bacillota bacterium]
MKTFLYVWIYVLLLAAVFYFVFDYTSALSFFLGSTVSVMLMSHNYKRTMRAAEKDPQSLKRVAMVNYAFRYAFYILILTLAHLSDGLDIIFTFIGFLSFKITMLISMAIGRIYKEGSDDA